MAGIGGHWGGQCGTTRVTLAKTSRNGGCWAELAIFCNQPRVPLVVLEHQPSYKTFALQSTLPARCTGVMVAQKLWEGPTNDWSMRPPCWNESNIWHCLNGQEPEARWLRDLEENKTWLAKKKKKSLNWLAQSSSEKLHPETDGNRCKDPQPNIR